MTTLAMRQTELQLFARDPQEMAQSQHKLIAWAEGRVEHLIRQQFMFSLVGGANEIQRNLIATRGLGLPRS